jgi:hypothetical protein
VRYSREKEVLNKNMKARKLGAENAIKYPKFEEKKVKHG